MNQTRKILPLLLASLTIGIVLGAVGHALVQPNISDDGVEVRSALGYTYINPLLECNLAPEYISENTLADFGSDIESIIEEGKDEGSITHAAVYFRDLNNGPWFGINEDDDFRPASLLKVPIMMYVFKQAEEDPQLLSKSVVYDGSDLERTQDITPGKSVVKGVSYTVMELVEYMIKYSDNKATAMIIKTVDPGKLEDLLGLVGITLPSADRTESDFVSLKHYAAFFRLLFNASYNTDEHSEQALKLLTQTQFDNGLRAGVPQGIEVAHKFGEAVHTVTGEKQLHDCGVVYYPKKPYLLCVSTKGTDFERMEKMIADISRVSYQAVDRQVKEGE